MKDTHENHEQGIEIPFERIDPETLRNMIGEFVSREWTEWGDAGRSHDDKVAQVLRQLEAHTAKVVYDLASESWNIVATK